MLNTTSFTVTLLCEYTNCKKINKFFLYTSVIITGLIEKIQIIMRDKFNNNVDGESSTLRQTFVFIINRIIISEILFLNSEGRKYQ